MDIRMWKVDFRGRYLFTGSQVECDFWRLCHWEDYAKSSRHLNGLRVLYRLEKLRALEDLLTAWGKKEDQATLERVREDIKKTEQIESEIRAEVVHDASFEPGSELEEV